MPDFRNYPVISTFIGTVLCAVFSYLVTLLVMNATDLPMLPEAAALAVGLPLVSVPLCLYPLLVMLDRQRRMGAELERLVRTDALTGLPNRRAFFSIASEMFMRPQDEGRPLAAMMIDVDNFKTINDSSGHDGGDRVLCDVSKVICDEVRKTAGDNCIVARLGGDEFAVLVEGMAASAVARLAERICAEVARRVESGAPGRQVTVSVGVALRIKLCLNIDGLLKSADEAAYAAKFAGRNRWVFAGDNTLADAPIWQPHSLLPELRSDVSERIAG